MTPSLDLNRRFPKAIAGAKRDFIERIKKKICNNKSSDFALGLANKYEDIDYDKYKSRYGDDLQNWYERNIVIGNFELKTENIYVHWEDKDCSLCFSFSTTMYLWENAGDNWIKPLFNERHVRMGEWPIRGRGCCEQ